MRGWQNEVDSFFSFFPIIFDLKTSLCFSHSWDPQKNGLGRGQKVQKPHSLAIGGERITRFSSFLRQAHSIFSDDYYPRLPPQTDNDLHISIRLVCTLYTFSKTKMNIPTQPIHTRSYLPISRAHVRCNPPPPARPHLGAVLPRYR